MADESQVAMLKRSVEEWNEWRNRHPHDSVALARADLNGHDLSGADLGIRSSEVRPDTTAMVSVDLIGTHLRGTRLHRVRFTGANLWGADLTGADLTQAKLLRANLLDALLFDADLSRARLGRTSLINLDLSTTRGLDRCEHLAPSFLDFLTLRNSRLPLAFLRGCGIPETVVTYLPSLLDQPVQFYSAFISYSTRDQSFADRLHADLQNSGVRCWFAPHDILPGKKLHDQIDEAIRIYDRLLLILSEASMASEWVKTEIANARQKELRQGRQVLFPISIVPYEQVREWRAFDADTGKDSAREIREYYIPDFTGWDKDHAKYKAAFDRLLKGLKAEDTRTP